MDRRFLVNVRRTFARFVQNEMRLAAADERIAA
jgi:hypothetical protein